MERRGPPLDLGWAASVFLMSAILTQGTERALCVFDLRAKSRGSGAHKSQCQDEKERPQQRTSPQEIKP